MINLVVALAAEARPLVDHFRLRLREDSRGFRIYAGEETRLVVTGIGKSAAAAGTAYLAGSSNGAANEAWLNVGIAGHRDLALGEGVHALRIIDGSSGRSWYPPQVLALPGAGATFTSVDNPESAYPQDSVYEMEASAYYSTAVRFSVGELVQVYKVISDNRFFATDRITKRSISESIGAHLPGIERIAVDLNNLAQELADAQPHLGDVDRFLERWHFTVSQEHQLRAVLQQWASRVPNVAVWDESLNRCPSAKSVLAELRARLDQFPAAL